MGISKKETLAGKGKWILLKGLLHDFRAVEMLVLFSVVTDNNLAFFFGRVCLNIYFQQTCVSKRRIKDFSTL